VLRLQPTAPVPTATAAPPPVSTAVKPVQGGTLTVGMAQEAISLDPVGLADAYSGAVLNAVVDTLYEVDPGGNVVGRLVAQTATPQPHV
jgi:ABC-type transport system substrate-binding protein